MKRLSTWPQQFVSVSLQRARHGPGPTCFDWLCFGPRSKMFPSKPTKRQAPALPSRAAISATLSVLEEWGLAMHSQIEWCGGGLPIPRPPLSFFGRVPPPLYSRGLPPPTEPSDGVLPISPHLPPSHRVNSWFQDFMDRSQPFQSETLDNAHNVMSVFEYLLMLHNDLLDLEVVAAIEAA